MVGSLGPWLSRAEYKSFCRTLGWLFACWILLWQPHAQCFLLECTMCVLTEVAVKNYVLSPFHLPMIENLLCSPHIWYPAPDVTLKAPSDMLSPSLLRLPSLYFSGFWILFFTPSCWSWNMIFLKLFPRTALSRPHRWYYQTIYCLSLIISAFAVQGCKSASKLHLTLTWCITGPICVSSLLFM